MSIIRPFRSVRPAKEKAASIAALPYDVYHRKEAKEIVAQNPLSFLKIDRAETQFPDETDMYSPQVYTCARDILEEMISNHSFLTEETPCYYLYALTLHGRTQTGIVGCASIDDYQDGTIRRHENTKEDKELDRIRHVDTLSAQTGPIFLAYRPQPELKQLTKTIKSESPLYDFISEDQVRHQVWKIGEQRQIEQISDLFSQIRHLYIADGHHRAASAVKIGLRRRSQHPYYDGTEEFNYFLSVLFPADELQIFDYNRVVTGLNGYTFKEFLQKVREKFEITEISASFTDSSLSSCRPQQKGEITMYGQHTWYRLKAHRELYTGDPVSDLDVSILQDFILNPLLGIQDPKTDPRLQFVGGIRGLSELVRLVDAGEKEVSAPTQTPVSNFSSENSSSTESALERIAFAMYPTSMEELLLVADSGRLMPPKSTWFEPKLRSGLFIHKFEE